MAGWIMMPLGTEVNLSPGDVVLDGSQLPLCPCLLWPKRYGDGAGNAVEDNSSVFFLIRMR